MAVIADYVIWALNTQKELYIHRFSGDKKRYQTPEKRDRWADVTWMDYRFPDIETFPCAPSVFSRGFVYRVCVCVCVLQEVELRALCMLGKYSTMELHPQPPQSLHFENTL
jgi:hypothetical protein